MSGPEEQIGVGSALARLAVARAFRSTAVFTHRAGTPNTLAIRIVGNWNEMTQDGRGVLSEKRCLKIWVSANQSGLLPATGDSESIIPGDTFVLEKYANRTYQVVAPVELDASGHVYILTIEEQKRLNSGVA